MRQIVYLLKLVFLLRQNTLQQYNQVVITMEVIIKDNKFVFINKTNFPKNVDNNLYHEIDFIIKRIEFLAEHTKKVKLVDYCPSISVGTIFMNT